MKLIPDWLLSAMGDGATPANTSMSRLCILLTVLCCICGPSLLWFGLSCVSGKLLEIPGSVIGFMAASGSLIGAIFVINKRSE